MKNNVLVEMLEAEGFTAFEDENDPAQRMQEFCNSAGHLDGLVLLRRDFKFATGDATHASVLVVDRCDRGCRPGAGVTSASYSGRRVGRK